MSSFEESPAVKRQRARRRRAEERRWARLSGPVTTRQLTVGELLLLDASSRSKATRRRIRRSISRPAD